MAFIKGENFLGEDYQYYSDQNASQLAPEYSTSATYAVGDYVVYNKNLYRCISAISTAESWTSGHWTQVKAGQEITQLKEDLNELTIYDGENSAISNDGSFSGFISEYKVNGNSGYIGSNGNFTAHSDYKTFLIPIFKPANVWLSAFSYNFMSFGVYKSDTLNSTNLLAFYSKNNSNIPLENSKLNLTTSCYIAISVIKTNVFTLNLSYTTVKDKIFELSNAETNLRSTVNNLSNTVSAISETEYIKHKKASELFTLYGTNGYISSDGTVIAHSNYAIYYFVVREDCQFWVDAPENYMCIGVYNSTTFISSNVISVYTKSGGTIPLENNKATILSGNIVAVSIVTSDDFGLYLSNEYRMSAVDIVARTNEASKIKIEKTATNAFDIKVPCHSGKVVRYEFTRYLNTWASLEYEDAGGNTQTVANVKSSDMWNNIWVVNDETSEHIAQGNTNFIIMKDGHYSGDGHGNEVMLSFSVYADGIPVDLDTMPINEPVSCGELRIISRSKMFKVGGNTTGDNTGDTPDKAWPALDTSGNPIVDFIHYMEISFAYNNIVKMQNKLIVQNDNTSLEGCFGAMLSCDFGTFSKIMVDNAEQTENNVASDGTTTVTDGSTINLYNTRNFFGSVVEMYGENYYVRQSMKNVNENDRTKQALAVSYYDSSLKVYFIPVITSSRYPSGYTPDVFNAWDVISVENERVIEI